MGLRDWPFKAMALGRRALGKRRSAKILESYSIPSSERERLAAGAKSDFARLFYAHKGRPAHKWIHCLDIYDRHFSSYRNTPVKMLEIGVAMGGSLELWRKYFGADATIFGVDVAAVCANYVTAPNQVRIGSQADAKFLRAVAAELGTPDIILDDGSHIGRHQRISFDTLFPLLAEGGLYVIEDLHSSYILGEYEGGYRRGGTGIEFVKEIIDDMHAWYHSRGTRTPARDWIGAIHIYDSIVVIEKRKVERPGHIMVS